MWVWAGAYTHMEGIGCPNLSLFDLLSWEKISHWAWDQASNQQAPGMFIFCPLQCWSIHSHAQLFSWILGIQTQVFMLLKQNTLTLSYLWARVLFFLSFLWFPMCNGQSIDPRDLHGFPHNEINESSIHALLFPLKKNLFSHTICLWIKCACQKMRSLLWENSPWFQETIISSDPGILIC